MSTKKVLVSEAVEHSPVELLQEVAVGDVDAVAVVEKAPADFIEYVQNQFENVKIDVKQRVNNVIAKFPVKTEEILSLKETLKTEATHLYEDISKTTQAFKTEVVEISLKHKSHLVDGLKRSKDNAYGAINKINPSKIDHS